MVLTSLPWKQTPPPTPKKLGRLPGHMPHALRDLTHYVAGNLPAPPTIRPVPAPGNGDWGMDGNDIYGDCGVAGIHHGDMCVEYDTGTPRVNVTSQQVVDYYMAYTGNVDNGVVLADFLKYVKTTGFYGHKLTAYAPIKVSDVQTLKFAVNAYSFAYTGIVVTQGMMDATDAHQPWTAANATGTVLGGHCVPIVGYGLDELWVITWGQLQSVAYSAWPVIAEEAWACIWSEVAAKGVHGVKLAALQADLAKLNV